MATMNNSFLNSVAHDLYERYQSDMTKVVAVFPNKRASLFFSNQLAKVSSKPVWAPQYMTISELFQSFSPYALAEPISCVCELYRCYCDALHCTESIVDFFGWGEVILSDLNDMDKQLVNVMSLFQYAKDWNQLSQTADFLTEDQIAAIQRYFKDFSSDEKEKAKKRFMDLWQAMPVIYDSMKKKMLESGLLYDGALCRDVVENQLDKIDPDKTYVFVGFNVLTKVQEVLLENIKLKANALFYWDYDEHLTAQSEGIERLMYESGEYIRKYLKKMPNSYKAEGIHRDSPLALTYIKTDSANAQVRYVPKWVEENADKSALSETAVLLADESLLPQVLCTLPDEKVNITMGYKLSDTPVLSWIVALIHLQLRGTKPDHKQTEVAEEQENKFFYASFFNQVKNHAFASELPLEVWNKRIDIENGKEILDYLDQTVLAVLSSINANQEHHIEVYYPLYAEALYRAHLSITTLKDIPFDFGTILTCRLLERILRAQSVPFHGEPIEGLQVMGMLESRTLDFQNILILSANDGVLPKRGQTTSLVPYCMREPFGLTTEKEQINIYAYNFFSLLQRADTVTMMFPTSSNDMGQCEMSRFMRQLLAETSLEIKTKHLDFTKVNDEIHESTISQIKKDSRKLEAYSEMLLSPSALNTYMNCPLSFYYRYMAKLNTIEEFDTTLQANRFGTLFHSSAEIFYTHLIQDSKQRRITKEMLEAALNSDRIEIAVDEAFAKVIFNQPESDVKEYAGELVIARNVIQEYLHRLIQMDMSYTPFKMLQMEKRHYAQMDVTINGKQKKLSIGGIIDRLDYVECHPKTGLPAIRIVDYKTGINTDKGKCDSIDAIFDRSDKKDPGYVFQTFLYSMAIKDELEGRIQLDPEIESQNGGPIQLVGLEKQSNIIPSLIFIAAAKDVEKYDALLYVGKNSVLDFNEYINAFKEQLSAYLNTEMFNMEIPYRQTANENHCKYCDYRLLCGKKEKE